MNKVGYIQVIGLVVMIFIVVDAMNLINTLSKPENTLLELGEICPLHEKNYDLCLDREGDILLKGEIEDDIDLQLKINEKEVRCSISNDNIKIRTVCKDEFGSFIRESNFEIDFIIDNVVMASITRNELRELLVRGFISNPKIIGKRALRFAEKNPELMAIPLFIHIFKEELQ